MHKTTKKYILWRCTKNRSKRCQCKVKTTDGKIIAILNFHNHDVEQKFKNVIRE
ncbi:hypothetical protein JYU34_004394 [Plutella xylostella]|uniref:FLYWCH-type domain-containing protein n=1 Tax=Plutella xylostella TaxID=51655 RepID=A0ABQ7QXV2_PLUXY|nr:hypothetical protein JYU34_004394 [Plutella xylostella]